MMRKSLLKFFALSVIITVLFQAVPKVSMAGSGSSFANPELQLQVLSRTIDNSGTPRFFESLNTGSSSPSLFVDPVSVIHSKGYVPSRITLQPSTAKIRLYADVPLPSSYDLRSQDGVNRLSSVKNQGSSGACWAFSAIGSMESSLLPFLVYDFSENNLKNESGFDLHPNTGGGNNDMAIAYFARWGGPLSEEDDPYNPTSTSSTPAAGTVLRHLQNVKMLPGRNGSTDNAAIKKAIMEHGAVSVSMYMGGPNEIKITQNQTLNYYTSTVTDANHAVNLIGWIDGRSASDFKDYANGNATPRGDGAFIAKNSWGSAWGDLGFFYISYYDENLAYDMNGVFYGAESATNYADIYQYDPLGCTGWVPGSVGSDIWMANVFTKKASDGPLAAVSFYTLQSDTIYNVYVCTDYTGSSDLVSSRVSAATGTIAGYGYYTVDLDIPILIAPGDRFAVIVQLSSSGGAAHAPVEHAVAGYSSLASARPGESFVSVSGSFWQDLTSIEASANFSLKAFTSAKNVTGISLKSLPSKTTYMKGSPLDLSGAEITATYIDGSHTDIPVTLDMVSGYNANTLGAQTVTITYESRTTSFSVTVIADFITDPVTGLILDASTGAIAGFTGNPVNLVIPAEISGIRVTSIKDAAFSGCVSLVSVTIPASVSFIDDYAFNDCSSLSRVVFQGDRPAIATRAFGSNAGRFALYYPGFHASTWTGYSDYPTRKYDIVVLAIGDVNGDSMVNALDLLKLKKHLLGQIVITSDNALAADVTGDGRIDALDLLRHKKFLLGQITLE